jgi:hypothetical protein
LRKQLGLIKPDVVAAEPPQAPAPNGKAAQPVPPGAKREQNCQDIKAAIDTELRKQLGLIKPDVVAAEPPQAPAPNGKAAQPVPARR